MLGSISRLIQYEPLNTLTGDSAIDLFRRRDRFGHDGLYIIFCRAMIDEARPQRELSIDRSIRRVYAATRNQPFENRFVIFFPVTEAHGTERKTPVK